MDHVPRHSDFNPAHVIKDGRGGFAAGWDGERSLSFLSITVSATHFVGKPRTYFNIDG